ncbi:uncharacterized protein I303_105897 [Kwoniella dejecticola CBS 10117]|uniref:Uncharacterized protein n=1 Tax=Kwoniella dejecticola CBS 10117 TaxID=1296121 RepID=A0A1A6A0Q3_9TREE|nr:uncharacterized protein I303_05919 [Kwoniella dejecticola CBS 10117]OBR83639.1 hypothetical protein I303_05919 [Kwoniella dejecticola CBS 10117]
MTVNIQDLVKAAYPGYQFIQATLTPPKAYYHGEICSNSVCSYLEIPSDHDGNVYYTEFRHGDITNIYQMSREDLCRAWAYGLNGSVYHNYVYDILKEASLTEVNYSIEAYTSLQRLSRGELEITLKLLHAFERQAIVLSELQPMKRYTVHDLRLSASRATSQMRPEELTPLFLYAAQHIIKMREIGYAQEFELLPHEFPSMVQDPPYILPGAIDNPTLRQPAREAHSNDSDLAREGSSSPTKHVRWDTALVAVPAEGGSNDHLSVSSTGSSTPMIKRIRRGLHRIVQTK